MLKIGQISLVVNNGQDVMSTMCVWVCVLTCCRLLHSLLEDGALVLTLRRGAFSSSASTTSSTAQTGLADVLASFGGAAPEGLSRCNSRMVRTREQYLQK